MKTTLFIFVILIFGAINLSATRAERLIGKWKAYKMIHEGEMRNFEDGKSKRIPWIVFKENNRVWVGEGERNEERGEWWLEDENKTIHLILKNRDRGMIIKRFSKERMVTQFKDGRSSTKAFWRKMP